MIQKAIHELVENKNLDFETTKEVMDEIRQKLPPRRDILISMQP